MNINIDVKDITVADISVHCYKSDIEEELISYSYITTADQPFTVIRLNNKINIFLPDSVLVEFVKLGIEHAVKIGKAEKNATDAFLAQLEAARKAEELIKSTKPLDLSIIKTG